MDTKFVCQINSLRRRHTNERIKEEKQKRQLTTVRSVEKFKSCLQKDRNRYEKEIEKLRQKKRLDAQAQKIMQKELEKTQARKRGYDLDNFSYY